MEANVAQLGALPKNRSVGIEENDEKFQSQHFAYFTLVLCSKSRIQNGN
jgi:hypothetical protein